MLISLLIGLLVVGVIYWAITYLPLPPVFKQVATVILVVVAVIWLIGVVTGRSYLGV